jgi:hypothetical protein
VDLVNFLLAREEARNVCGVVFSSVDSETGLFAASLAGQAAEHTRLRTTVKVAEMSVWRRMDRTLTRFWQAIARGGWAVEVGPLRLLVGAAWIVDHVFPFECMGVHGKTWEMN